MHITVAGKQVDTGEALRVHVQDGLAAISRKYFDHALEANVTFRRDHKARPGSAFCCDINLKAGRNLFMRGEGEGPDAHRAFDVAAEHLAKRLRRYRRRVNDHARSLAEERDLSAEPARQVVLQQPDEEAPGEEDEAAPLANGHDHGVVVAEASTNILRLSVGEAVMRLDLEQRVVLMFRNSGTGAVNVVYRREDGNIGWIDAAPR
jgi:ribosomal subunit interface protein